MTEISWWWDGHTTGDAAVNAPYDMDQWATTYKLIYTADPSNQGVIGGTLGSLAVAATSTSTISVSSGVAIVNGRLYYNDDPIILTVNGDSSYWIIGLVSDSRLQTVRIFHRGGYLDKASALASLVHLSYCWEIPLAVVFVASTGIISTVHDQRLFVLRPEKNREFIPAVGCLNYTDTVDIVENDIRGYPIEDNHYVLSYGNLIVPNNFWKLLSVKAVVVPAASGNIYSRTYIEYGSFNNADEEYNNRLQSMGFETTAVVANYVNLINTTFPLDDLKRGLGGVSDFLTLTFVRDSISVPGGGTLDTLSSTVYFSGWIVEYAVLF